uniref:Uncharacterized protein n=1 Tax=Eutreptiella gymnastica TaxID=73025 RepID=A0A7S4C7B3_9EUGL
MAPKRKGGTKLPKIASKGKPAPKQTNKAPAKMESSPKSSSSVTPVQAPSAQVLPAVPSPTQEASSKDSTTGTISVKFSAYEGEFSLKDGKVTAAVLDDEFAISFAFSEKVVMRMLMPDGTEQCRGLKDTFSGLVPGTTYQMECDEDDEVLEAEGESQGIAWGVGKQSGIAGMATNDGSGAGGIPLGDKANCSCLEGNPCASPENCRDWKNRESVAAAVRKKKRMGGD